MPIAFHAVHRVVHIPGLGLVELMVQVNITPEEPTSPAATEAAGSPLHGSLLTTTRTLSPIPTEVSPEASTPPVLCVPSPFEDALSSQANSNLPGTTADNPLVLMTSSQPCVPWDTLNSSDGSSDLSSLTSLDELLSVSSVFAALCAP
ncbi:hypothetical protein FRC08_012957 [Ceratobasidium sp. 394]|nr:hypothetical protein FRC08_012957 [Ceratobasidium sp. 394]